MLRTILLVLPLFLIVLMSGCATKPQPATPPDEITEAYLLQHMRVTHKEKGQVVNVLPQGIVDHPRFLGGSATLQTTFDAEITLNDERSEVSAFKPPVYLLLFTMSADAWGAFRSAVDTFGKRHAVTPYTSFIRSGVYYENFYIILSRKWLEAAALSETSLLLLGAKGELSVTIPAIYPRALLRYIDARTFLTGRATE